MERMLRLEFVESTESIAVWLQGQAHVRLVRTEGHIAEIGFGGSRAEQAALVGACIAAGHALVGIASITENLQQSYLKSLAAERATTKPATRMQP